MKPYLLEFRVLYARARDVGKIVRAAHRTGLISSVRWSYDLASHSGAVTCLGNHLHPMAALSNALL